MISVDVQYASTETDLPLSEVLQGWASTAHENVAKPSNAEIDVVIRIVDRDESATLNEKYRSKVGPTNVLSFPMDVPEGVPLESLGDLVICAPIVRAEAKQQNKSETAHWAHMVVHGILHLHGFDHNADAEASVMENRERKIMQQLGFEDPYRPN